jgi:hypothetical protein
MPEQAGTPAARRGNHERSHGGLRGAIRRRRQKRILRGMLAQGTYTWRKLSTLAKAVGEQGPDGQDRVRALLTAIKARASAREGDQEVWGLISRVGNPRRR